MQINCEKFVYLQIFLYLCTRKMINILSRIWKSSSARNVGKLLSANVFAQLLGILVYPILTRMYAPEEFALLSLFTSILGVAVLVATGEYQYAIVLPKEEEKARALVKLSGTIMLVVVGVFCLSLPFSSSIVSLFHAPELAHWWWAMPLSVAVIGSWNILNYWYIRRKAFTRISGYQVSQSALSAGAKIGLGALGQLHGGMILASVMAPLLSILISIGLAWKKHLSELFSSPATPMKEVAREYANFPKYNLPHALVNSLAQAMPVWLLTPVFGLKEVGMFSLAMMASYVPLSIIARACYQVLFQKVSVLVQDRQPITSVLRQFMFGMSAVLLVGMGAIYWVMPQLVTFLFGTEWLESASIIRALYPYLVLTPICGTICFLSDVFGKQKAALWMEAAYVLMMGVALETGIHCGGFMTSIWLLSWTRFAYLLVQMVWFLSLVRNYHKTLS